MAISTDPPSESLKTDRLLGGAFPLLSDPDLRVIRAYKMEHEMGGTTVGDMGYAIIDGQGRIRRLVMDPLFGQHADAVLQALTELQPSR